MSGAMLLAVLAGCGDDDSPSSAPEASDASITSASTAETGGAEATAEPSASPVVIGTVGAFSGTFGAQYSRGAEAVKAWAEMVNASGGLNGHPVEVKVVDDFSDGAKALAGLKQLIENDHAIAIVGAFAPGTDAAWSDYLTEKKVPVIGGLSASTAVWYTNPYFFPAQNRAVEYIKFSFDVAKRSNAAKVGVLICTEFSACQEGVPIIEQAAADAGVNFAGSIGLPAAAPDYTAQCLEFKGKDVDLLVPEVSQTITLKAIQDCDRQGYNPGLVLPDSPAEDVLSDELLQGAYLAYPSPLGFIESPLTHDFRAAMAMYAPDVSLNEWAATSGWQAALLFGEAAKALPASPTAADVLAGLYALPDDFTNSGWSPPLTFTEGKPATTPQTLGWIGRIEDGKLTAPFGSEAIGAG